MNQLGLGGRCLTRNPGPERDANLVMFLKDYETGVLIASRNLYCDGTVSPATALATVKPGHHLYITAQTLNARFVPYAISLAAYRRE